MGGLVIVGIDALRGCSCFHLARHIWESGLALLSVSGNQSTGDTTTIRLLQPNLVL